MDDIPKPGSACQCAQAHACRLVALTGGPGAGKTAVLEVARRHLCRHVVILPEAASIVFGGGFPRGTTEVERRAAQCAIFAVQRQLERIAEQSGCALALCDRGTLDGLAYWPASAASFWQDVGSTPAHELARYAAVVHLRTPQDNGYTRSNPVRIESAAQARQLDERILGVWSEHPRRTVIPSTVSFLDKLAAAVAAIRAEVPACCAGTLVAV